MKAFLCFLLITDWTGTFLEELLYFGIHLLILYNLTFPCELFYTHYKPEEEKNRQKVIKMCLVGVLSWFFAVFVILGLFLDLYSIAVMSLAMIGSFSLVLAVLSITGKSIISQLLAIETQSRKIIFLRKKIKQHLSMLTVSLSLRILVCIVLILGLFKWSKENDVQLVRESPNSDEFCRLFDSSESCLQYCQ